MSAGLPPVSVKPRRKVINFELKQCTFPMIWPSRQLFHDSWRKCVVGSSSVFGFVVHFGAWLELQGHTPTRVKRHKFSCWMKCLLLNITGIMVDSWNAFIPAVLRQWLSNCIYIIVLATGISSLCVNRRKPTSYNNIKIRLWKRARAINDDHSLW